MKTKTKTIPAPQAVIDELLRTMGRYCVNNDSDNICGWAEDINIGGLHYYADIEATADREGEVATYDEPAWSEVTVDSIDRLSGEVLDDDDNTVAVLDFNDDDFIGARL